MALQPVNIGTNPNDGTGDPLRTAFDKLNQNDSYLEGLSLTVPSKEVSAGTYSVVLGDMGHLINLSGAANQVVTIPAWGSSMPSGTIILFMRTGSGVPTIQGSGGVTVNGVNGGSYQVPVRYSLVAAIKTSVGNVWALTGGIG